MSTSDVASHTQPSSEAQLLSEIVTWENTVKKGRSASFVR